MTETMKKYKVNVNGTDYEIAIELMDGNAKAEELKSAPKAAPEAPKAPAAPAAPASACLTEFFPQIPHRCHSRRASRPPPQYGGPVQSPRTSVRC